MNSSRCGHAARLHLDDRVLEHRLVELEPDLLDVARLLVAEQIAGAADVEIVAGELEARAEAVELGEHLQPLLRRLGDRSVGRHRQISVSARLGAADAAAELVELGKAEPVGAIDDERVRARNVEPAFDDRGRQQHVIFAVVEGAHPLLDLGRRSSARGR